MLYYTILYIIHIALQYNTDGGGAAAGRRLGEPAAFHLEGKVTSFLIHRQVTGITNKHIDELVTEITKKYIDELLKLRTNTLTSY